MSHFIEDLMTKKRSYDEEINSLYLIFNKDTYILSLIHI